MPLPALHGTLLRGLFASAAVTGVAAEGAAAKGSQAAGSALFKKYVEGNVAKGSTRLFRGVAADGITSEFTAPAAGVPGIKNYVSSRAAAEAAAGKGGQVFRIDVPTPHLAGYSPSPLAGGTTQYSVPFAQHAANATQVMANPNASAGGAGQAMRNWLQNSSVGKAYSGIRDLAGWKPTPNPGPATVQPYMGGGPSYPSIHPSQLMGMAGQSQSQIAQTNATSATMQAHEQREIENKRRLNDITSKLTQTFKDMIFNSTKHALLWGTGIGQYGFGKVVTAATSGLVDSSISEHAQYSAVYAEMGIRRRFHDIQLSRETADAVGWSDQMLNESNMEGRRLLSEIHRDLKPIYNTILTGTQELANIGLRITQMLMGPMVEILKKLGIGENEIDKMFRPPDIAATLIREAILANKGARDSKRRKPLPPIR